MTTFFGGPEPCVFDEQDKPCLFKSKLEAQREIADFTIMRIREFTDGERDFEDPMTVEEYVVAVELFPDGTIVDEFGKLFGK